MRAVSRRTRSWKSLLAWSCALLAGTYLTFQLLAWFVIGPQDDLISNDLMQSLERVTSGFDVAVHDADSDNDGARHDRDGGVLLKRDPPASGPPAVPHFHPEKQSKSSSLLRRFGSRNALLSAIRHVMHGPAKQSSKAVPEQPKGKKWRRSRVINKEMMRRAKAAVALRKKRKALGLKGDPGHAEGQQNTHKDDAAANHISNSQEHKPLPPHGTHPPGGAMSDHKHGNRHYEPIKQNQPRSHPNALQKPDQNAQKPHANAKAKDHQPAHAKEQKRQRSKTDHSLLKTHKSPVKGEKLPPRMETGHAAAGVGDSHNFVGHAVPRLRGISPDQKKFYDLKPPKLFHCLDGKGDVLPLDRINDEYCDCSDGSDEPGTSACSNGRFYCAPEKRFLFSSRVDDGRCDCCDGSDELKPPVQKCESSCKEFERLAAAIAKRQEEALALRQKYVEEGRMAPPGEDYGPDKAFYPLRTKCFSKRQGEYDYEVCPFQRGQQIKQGQSTQIGAGGRWVALASLPTIVMLEKPSALLRTNGGRGDAYSVLRMENGAACPGGMPRILQIAFDCDVEERLKAIGETEKCQYTALISTPAACIPHK